MELFFQAGADFTYCK